MPLQVQSSDDAKLEVHASVKIGLKLTIVTRLGERCTSIAKKICATLVIHLE